MRKLGVFTVLVGLMVVGFALAAAAHGDGSPEACKTAQEMTGGDDLMEYEAPDGYVVSGVCIKAGQLHTGPLGNGAGACYTVAGVGTSEASVTRTGQPGPDCQEISHVDVAIATTTTTSQGETTTTTIEDETTTTTTIVDETTTTVGEETTTTSPDDPTTTTVPVAPTTTTPAVSTSDTLPFTGLENAPGLWVAGVLAIMAGIGLVWRARSE